MSMQRAIYNKEALDYISERINNLENDIAEQLRAIADLIAAELSRASNAEDDIRKKYIPRVGALNITGNIGFDIGDDSHDVIGIYGRMGGNDFWRVGGGSSARDDGFLELATSDGGKEPIYARQYGLSEDVDVSTLQITDRYSRLVHTFTILDENGDTAAPGNMNIGKNLEVAGSISSMNHPDIWIGPDTTSIPANRKNVLVWINTTDSRLYYRTSPTSTSWLPVKSFWN